MRLRSLVPVAATLLVSCEGGGGELYVERPPPPPNDGLYGFAHGCYALDATEPGSTNTRWLAASEAGDRFAFTATSLEEGARLYLQPSDLGTYLLHDESGHYVLGDAEGLLREDELLSDILLVDDTYRSPAEWELEVSPVDPERFRMRSYRTGEYLTRDGLDPDPEAAAVVALYPREGCVAPPELTLDAEGEVEPRAWDDGDVFGIVETHSHLFTNFGFGGGGIFHGAPFHRLGVEHALPSCEPFHGLDGRRDLVGFAFSGLDDADPDALLNAFLSGRTPEANHRTDGYPTFTDWPNSWSSSTHQTQYYRWVQRAYLGGLRLLVQHATTNSVLCEMITGINAQRVRYSCNDMVAVEREIAETYALERYVDAQHGGPGRGWFRVVTSPEEARRVIGEGRLAVVLGIETSNLFDCFLTPPPGMPACDEAHMRRELERFHALGVRALFPTHKFDNGFSAGDGDRNVGQIGSFINSGHYSNLVLDCPDSPSVFDHGGVRFGGLNMPRDEYGAPAPNDMSGFADNPIATLAPHLDALQAPGLEGDYCQNAGLTPVGEALILEMMRRGMILEVDHLPRRSFVRAYELLVENDYPAVGSHGNTNRGLVYELGGVSKLNLGRCADPARPGAMGDSLRATIAEIRAHGGYPAEGFGFDLNGFAGGPRPRFGPESRCGDVPQSHPMTYPFTSYAGDVTFTEPHLGERTVDFDTEGMIHLGLVPELIEELRRDGVTDEELEPLFRSAEGYLRMWERAEARGRALSGG
jgi:microsomal dipeptidase-like Zn-dependent dipeptidase